MPTPPFNWIPDEWKSDKAEDKPDLTKDPNSQTAAPVFNKPNGQGGAGAPPKLNGSVDLGPRVGNLKSRPGILNIGHFTATKANEPNADSDPNTTLSQVPHPHSNFKHVDPPFLKGTASGQFKAAIDTFVQLEGLAGQDGEVDDNFKKALPQLRNLADLLSPNPKGMQRLKLLSDHILVRIIVLLGEMNAALDDDNRQAYTDARAEYIDILTDLDDREPRNVTPASKGYGRPLQWFYVKPIIHAGRIKGAKVMAKWNPHMSSSGVPIPHS